MNYILIFTILILPSSYLFITTDEKILFSCLFLSGIAVAVLNRYSHIPEVRKFINSIF